MFFSPFAIPIIAIVMAGLYPIIRAYAKRMESGHTTAPATPDIANRLDRIEHALEAVAVEVERITEGQRFTTRLLSEGRNAVDAPGPVSAAQPERNSAR